MNGSDSLETKHDGLCGVTVDVHPLEWADMGWKTLVTVEMNALECLATALFEQALSATHQNLPRPHFGSGLQTTEGSQGSAHATRTGKVTD